MEQGPEGKLVQEMSENVALVRVGFYFFNPFSPQMLNSHISASSGSDVSVGSILVGPPSDGRR